MKVPGVYCPMCAGHLHWKDTPSDGLVGECDTCLTQRPLYELTALARLEIADSLQAIEYALVGDDKLLSPIEVVVNSLEEVQ